MTTAPLTSEREETSLYRPIRVLSVIPVGTSIASMIFARRQVTGLRHAGVACKVFFLASRTSPSTLITEWRRLRQEIHSFRPDLLHAQYGTVTALLTGVSARVPFVVTFRGSDLNPDPTAPCVLWWARRLTSEIAALRANQIICVSEELRDRLWWRKSRATVIPTGVDTRIFYPRPRAEARFRLGWKEDERVVLFNAGGHPRLKRIDLAQAALEAARSLAGDIRFVVLNGNVNPNKVPIMMSAADCLLVTSDCEGSPNVVKEAMACNLPVVTVDVGDVTLRLEGVRPSRIVSRSPEDLGKAVAEILIQRQRSNGSSMTGELSAVATVSRIVSVYCAVVQEKSVTSTSALHSQQVASAQTGNTNVP